MDKDDKKTKLAARKMIEMELALNKAHFKGEIEVTCYTCHRGTAHPVGIPILSVEPAGRSPSMFTMKREEAHGKLFCLLPIRCWTSIWLP